MKQTIVSSILMRKKFEKGCCVVKTDEYVYNQRTKENSKIGASLNQSSIIKINLGGDLKNCT